MQSIFQAFHLLQREMGNVQPQSKRNLDQGDMPDRKEEEADHDQTDNENLSSVHQVQIKEVSTEDIEDLLNFCTSQATDIDIKCKFSNKTTMGEKKQVTREVSTKQHVQAKSNIESDHSCKETYIENPYNQSDTVESTQITEKDLEKCIKPSLVEEKSKTRQLENKNEKGQHNLQTNALFVTFEQSEDVRSIEVAIVPHVSLQSNGVIPDSNILKMTLPAIERTLKFPKMIPACNWSKKSLEEAKNPCQWSNTLKLTNTDPTKQNNVSLDKNIPKPNLSIKLPNPGTEDNFKGGNQKCCMKETFVFKTKNKSEDEKNKAPSNTVSSLDIPYLHKIGDGTSKTGTCKKNNSHDLIENPTKTKSLKKLQSLKPKSAKNLQELSKKQLITQDAKPNKYLDNFSYAEVVKQNAQPKVPQSFKETSYLLDAKPKVKRESDKAYTKVTNPLNKRTINLVKFQEKKASESAISKIKTDSLVRSNERVQTNPSSKCSKTRGKNKIPPVLYTAQQQKPKSDFKQFESPNVYFPMNYTWNTDQNNDISYLFEMPQITDKDYKKCQIGLTEEIKQQSNQSKRKGKRRGLVDTNRSHEPDSKNMNSVNGVPSDQLQPFPQSNHQNAKTEELETQILTVIQEEPHESSEQAPECQPSRRWIQFQVDRSCTMKCQCKHCPGKLPPNVEAWLSISENRLAEPIWVTTMKLASSLIAGYKMCLGFQEVPWNTLNSGNAI